jgi:hypothetical protein
MKVPLTANNPFGPTDYSNIFSPQQMADIKGQHLGVTMNPNNVPWSYWF